jgi:hypothetical protein
MKKRNAKGKFSIDRDSGGFMAIPWSVVDSSSYQTLSHYAKSLLFDVARQFVRDNNGRLLMSLRHMRTRGWNSSSMLHKSKKELIDGGFIFETVKGYRPNKASWYALTWMRLDKINGYDEGAALCFERSAYKWKNQYEFKSVIPSKGSRPTNTEPSQRTT